MKTKTPYKQEINGKNKSTNKNAVWKFSKINNPLVTILSKGKKKIAEVAGMKARPLH